MNDSTLLLPDTGPEFFRTLNLAVLYSECVHVFSFTRPQTAIALASELRAFESRLIANQMGVIPDEILRLLPSGKECGEHPSESFLRLSEQHASLLALAETEGVVHSVSEAAVSNLVASPDRLGTIAAFFESLVTAFCAKNGTVRPEVAEWEEKMRPLPQMIGECPPSLFFLMERVFCDFFVCLLLTFHQKLPDEKIPKTFSENDYWVLHTAFAMYMLLASYYALSSGLATATWQPRVQELLIAGSDILLGGIPSANELLLQRRRFKNRLGQLILQEEVPNVADLPLEEVLEIRRKRRPEILRFRDGLQQLAADIDGSQDAKTIELALDTKIRTVFKPALRDLRNATAALQADAYKRLLDPTKDMGAALIPVAIALSASVPLDMTAMVGAGSALLAKLYEFVVGTAIEKRKVTNASPWSLLFHLQKEGGS